jgi:hypothetical protein
MSSCISACRQDRTFNVQFLKEEFDLGPEQIEALYQFAKFQFDCGNYSTASELLQVRSGAMAYALGQLQLPQCSRSSCSSSSSSSSCCSVQG